VRTVTCGKSSTITFSLCHPATSGANRHPAWHHHSPPRQPAVLRLLSEGKDPAIPRPHASRRCRTNSSASGWCHPNSVPGNYLNTRNRAQSMTTPGRNNGRYQAPCEGTAARLNEDGMSDMVVATIRYPPSPACGFLKKSSCLDSALSLRSGARACYRLIKRRLEIVASG
jgi:hypothetical protein